ncbi:MAG: transglycosylase SLT domain-containing protein [Solirubrobacteraceae bacterium]|nr:transglycosylase SLT domain-containing protein [Solirubrobacteraceae bacterium]
MTGWRSEGGQATILLIGVILAIVCGAIVLGGVARGIGARSDHQRAADLAALSAAKEMHARFGGLFATGGTHVELTAYRAAAVTAARETARRNGMEDVRVTFPEGDSFAPVRVRVLVGDAIEIGAERSPHTARAEAELAPPADVTFVDGGEGGYDGPLATRQGKRMRPDVAIAFDRMFAAARADGISLMINSAYRSNAEQARLFAQNPDPRMVAPPGKSLHRLGTELDLGPPGAYGWLAANAKRFGFVQRYSWEPWHYGFTRNAGSTSVGYGKGGRGTGKGSLLGGDGKRAGTLPSFVPARFAPMLSKAAQRWNVGAALLAAQIYAESNFNPYARSGAGAQGIAQFMPGTARAYGLENPFDAEAAIDAQAHLMRDLLRQLGSVPLALAAYNAGPAPVQRCGCVPAIPETRAYVAKILGLLGGAGELPIGGGLEVRLVA